jgi:hypothetical protein
MKILIDIGHPAHVHLFKNLGWQMQKKEHSFYFTVRKGEDEDILLKKFGFNYVLIGYRKKTKLGKLFGIIHFSIKIFINALKFRPDIFISHGSMYAGIAAYLLGKPHIALEDSGNMEQIKFSKPVSSIILSPNILPLNLGYKHLVYNGYHEIAYLHPKYFKANSNIIKEIGINQNDKFCILRFGSWKASHDIGHKGLTASQKSQIVKLLNKKDFKIIISSEANLPEEFKKYQIKLPPDKLHHIIAFADLIVSEGATIAAESGLLGVPTIYVNSIERCYNEDQEKYGTVFNFRSGNGVLEKIKEIINNKQFKYFAEMGSKKIFNDKIDVTAFFIWFIENYPESAKIMKANPDYQYKFK